MSIRDQIEESIDRIVNESSQGMKNLGRVLGRDRKLDIADIEIVDGSTPDELEAILPYGEIMRVIAINDDTVNILGPTRSDNVSYSITDIRGIIDHIVTTSSRISAQLGS